MEALKLEPSLQTPAIDFNPVSGKMAINGKSYPGDAIDFYLPLINWTRDYVKSNPLNTELICEIEYLNSASQKQMVELFMAFKLLISDNRLKVIWKYEEGDDDILTVGELIEHELQMHFEYEAV